MGKHLENMLAARTETTDALAASTADLTEESKEATTILSKLADELDRFGLAGHELTLFKLEGLGPKPETMQRAMQLVDALKRAGDEVAMADIIRDLNDELERFGKTARDVTMMNLKELGIWEDPEAARIAESLLDALDTAQASADIDDIIDGLERQRKALAHTTRELDLQEAAWKGAGKEQRAYINLLHEDIDAFREEQRVEAAAARHVADTKRITKFVEVDLSRTAISGLRGSRGRKQLVQDPDVVRELQGLRSDTRNRQPYAIVGP
jgi:hypothetical protein